ncbi:MAG: 16S rRNA (cytidine(1402)-2'-O)-methyltransferase [Deltaproteobacteria bacterium]|nr:16S rRNA (cytidine(1402)-2'-O)-methyltransferase [Deltaproteobacteria bacterium]MCL5792313.1 16S rRNA (cytidine(1402)-2'-O)-methyltransferase [Deltaproteobacteria bacterium]
MQNSAKLFIVSTPIGNLEDITIRAINILRSVDMIACEDTRTSSILLNRYNIKSRLKSFHKYSTKEQALHILNDIKQGKSLAYITDAGTPGISDPGAYLVKLAFENDIQVVPVPGTSAITCAASVSGMTEHGFIFLGFLPGPSLKKKKIINKFINLGLPVVFYESPHRLLNTVRVINDLKADCKMFIFKELTKMHEQILSGTPEDIISKYGSMDIIKGEYTIIVECEGLGSKKDFLEYDKKGLLEIASSLTGLDKREIYKRLFNK